MSNNVVPHSNSQTLIVNNKHCQNMCSTVELLYIRTPNNNNTRTLTFVVQNK